MLSLVTNIAPRLRQFCRLTGQLGRLSLSRDFAHDIHGSWYQRSLRVAEISRIQRLQLAAEDPHRCQVRAPSQPPEPCINRFLRVPQPHLSKRIAVEVGDFPADRAVGEVERPPHRHVLADRQARIPAPRLRAWNPQRSHWPQDSVTTT